MSLLLLVLVRGYFLYLYPNLIFLFVQKPEAVEVNSAGGGALLGPDGEVSLNIISTSD